jgi:hypothetical protein
VTKLNLLKEGCDPIQFMLAEGSTMLSDTVIPELQWHVQVIHSSLTLECYPSRGMI